MNPESGNRRGGAAGTGVLGTVARAHGGRRGEPALGSRPWRGIAAGCCAALMVLAACAQPAASPTAVPEASRTYVALPGGGVHSSGGAVGGASESASVGMSSPPTAGSAGATGGTEGASTDVVTGDPSAVTPTSGPAGSAADGVIPGEGGHAGSAAGGVIPSDAAGSARNATGTTTATATAPTQAEPSYHFTVALAGDINFAGRTADLLADGSATALRNAAAQLAPADLTMVNLETAITERGAPAPKQFHFRAPSAALAALAAGGVDVVTMANNHAVDYGDQGLADTLDAVDASPIPVLGIGRDAAQAYAPWTTTVNGVRVAFLAASQVHDWTIAAHTAGAHTPGIASAFAPRLVEAVRAAARQADAVIVYLHWGIEYTSCPSGEQRRLADALAAAGATAVVGTHAHVLQGAGWRSDGVYVAYGLGNYYWWRSFGNAQDDNGVLTLGFDRGRVVSANFLPTRLDDRGVPMVAEGSQRDRILGEWDAGRVCADLAPEVPSS